MARPLLLCITALALACSDSDDRSAYPYEENTTRVIGGSADGSSFGPAGNDEANADGAAGDGAGSTATAVPTSSVGTASIGEFETPAGDDCIVLDEVCVQPQSECGEGASADVIVGEDGEVLSTICYPNKNYEVVELGDQVENPTLGNRQVIVLDDEDDGPDVVGDLTVEGNNVIIWGDNPETSVIGGNLDIAKNNTIVRGVGVDGDVVISKNNASLLFCIIRGDLTITGNNVNLALCDIHGDVTITGNNAVFVSNRVRGDQPIEGINLRCNDNWRFEDDDDDGRVDDDEITEAIECISRGDSVADDADVNTRLEP